MNLGEVVAAGGHGIAYTVIGIVVALGIGAVLGKWLKNSETVSLLVSTGTAICGGSAIAAVGTAIGAAEIDMSVALITVFFLNSVALLVFPTIGHFLGLDQVQFGYWSALAIHDTSSVVGAAMQYGSEALKLATVVKLARALWIIPLTFAVGFFWSRRGAVKQKPKWPWFILYFLLAAAIVTWFPVLQGIGRDTNLAAKRLLVVTLFFIGSNIPPSAFKQKGGVMQRAAAQGLLLWVIVSVGSLAAIFWGWIR
jgi:uncharacterized membrane protein YadS